MSPRSGALTLEEARHVGREAGVVAGDPDVDVAGVAGRLERLVHVLVERRALGPAVVGDRNGHAGLLGEPEAHRLMLLGRVVAEREQLIAADLREGRSWVQEDEILERPRARAS